MKKKYGIAAIIACAVIVGTLAFTYSNTGTTNSVGNSQQPSASESSTANPSVNTTQAVTPPPPTTTGRHFSVGINETVSVRTSH